jgi:hypothetical protein
MRAREFIVAEAFMHDPARSEAGHEVKIATPPRAEFRGDNFRAQIVSKDSDLIYQFFGVLHADFRNFLAEIIESHFGSTDAFSAEYIPEVQSLGVRAKGVTELPFFNYDHYTVDFLGLVDRCLQES